MQEYLWILGFAQPTNIINPSSKQFGYYIIQYILPQHDN